MTEQEELQYLLDTSYNHVIKQGKPAAENKMCWYKSPEGLSCAAAPFIIEYNEEMERQSWRSLAIKDEFVPFLDPIAVKHCNFVAELQGAHDGASINVGNDEAFISEYRARIRNIVDDYDLTLPEIAA